MTGSEGPGCASLQQAVDALRRNMSHEFSDSSGKLIL
jgi:hypothetical protein